MKGKAKQIDRYQIRFDEEAFIDLFSGGGGKGAYEIGVWKALDHFGITPRKNGKSVIRR